MGGLTTNHYACQSKDGSGTVRVSSLQPLQPLQPRQPRFKNTYQSGFLSILYSIGSKPLQIWDKKAGRPMGYQQRRGANKNSSLLLIKSQFLWFVAFCSETGILDDTGTTTMMKYDEIWILSMAKPWVNFFGEHYQWLAFMSILNVSKVE